MIDIDLEHDLSVAGGCSTPNEWSECESRRSEQKQSTDPKRRIPPIAKGKRSAFASTTPQIHTPLHQQLAQTCSHLLLLLLTLFLAHQLAAAAAALSLSPHRVTVNDIDKKFVERLGTASPVLSHQNSGGNTRKTTNSETTAPETNAIFQSICSVQRSVASEMYTLRFQKQWSSEPHDKMSSCVHVLLYIHQYQAYVWTPEW